MRQERNRRSARERTAEIIFGDETPAARAFDVALIVAIVGSVITVMVETVTTIRADHRGLLRNLEWAFTVVFTIEYALRLWSAPQRRHYARSFFGVVDLLSIAPTYLSVLVPGGQAFAIVRALRVLRVFRILKLSAYVTQARQIGIALRQSREKIIVFMATVVTVVAIVGALMYLVERGSGFTSIPKGVYWAIVTLTTVGYGDLTPQTDLGRALAAVIMILGYGIIAVPTGIVTVELGNVSRRAAREARGGVECARCGLDLHEPDARFCRRCGERLAA
jgi:voltage-gated potassium channel